MVRTVLVFMFIFIGFSITMAGPFTKHDVKELWLAMVPQSDLPQVRLWQQHGEAIVCPTHEGKSMRMVQRTSWQIKEGLLQNKQVSPLFDNILLDSLVFDPRYEHYAYVAEKNGLQCVVLAGKAGVLYPEIVHGSLHVYSQSAKYIAREVGGNYHLIGVFQSGEEIKSTTICDDIRTESFRVAPNGRRSVYVARIGQQWCVVFKKFAEQRGKLYDDVGQPIFSPDSKKGFFSAKSNGKWRLAGTESADTLLPRYDEMGNLVFSPDSQAVIYPVRVGSKWGFMRCVAEPGVNKEAPVLNNGKYPPIGVEQDVSSQDYDAIGSYFFLTGGNTLVYTAKQGAKWLLMIGETVKGTYDDIGPLVLSPEQQQLTYTIRKGNQWFVVYKDVQYGPYDAIGAFSFSPKGNHLAFPAQQGARWSLVVDGSNGPGYERVDTPVWSLDGKRIAYIATRNGQSAVVLDGTPGVWYDEVGQPSFSPQGLKLAHAARKGLEWKAVMDGKESASYAAIIGKSVTLQQDPSPPQTEINGITSWSPMVAHYIAARKANKQINNEPAFDIIFIKELISE